MVMAIQYRMSDPTNFRNSRFRNVEAREENAVSCEGTVSTYSFSRIDQTKVGNNPYLLIHLYF